ncbi:hypothetical protein Bbelb_233100 [Branchiostoma belcheri]|nr:hypothetical protein Bbelb_233100 [Branchiostoma belcheri]
MSTPDRPARSVDTWRETTRTGPQSVTFRLRASPSKCILTVDHVSNQAYYPVPSLFARRILPAFCPGHDVFLRVRRSGSFVRHNVTSLSRGKSIPRLPSRRPSPPIHDTNLLPTISQPRLAQPTSSQPRTEHQPTTADLAPDLLPTMVNVGGSSSVFAASRNLVEATKIDVKHRKMSRLLASAWRVKGGPESVLGEPWSVSHNTDVMCAPAGQTQGDQPPWGR